MSDAGGLYPRHGGGPAAGIGGRSEASARSLLLIAGTVTIRVAAGNFDAAVSAVKALGRRWRRCSALHSRLARGPALD